MQTPDAFLTSGTGAHGSMVDKLKDACMCAYNYTYTYIHAGINILYRTHAFWDWAGDNVYIINFSCIYMGATVDDDCDQLCITW